MIVVLFSAYMGRFLEGVGWVYRRLINEYGGFFRSHAQLLVSSQPPNNSKDRQIVNSCYINQNTTFYEISAQCVNLEKTGGSSYSQLKSSNTKKSRFQISDKTEENRPSTIKPRTHIKLYAYPCYLQRQQRTPGPMLVCLSHSRES
jgi:hypothetical protein